VSHLTDDDLVLHYYGEDGPRLLAAERHLQSCPQCARAFDALARTLNAVQPPAPVEPEDDTVALRRLLREHSNGRPALVTGGHMRPRDAALIALVWAAAVCYPFSFEALFTTARLAAEHTAALPLVALTLAWACGGPAAAVLALHALPADRFARFSTRVVLCGAVLAAISPAVFPLVSRMSGALLRSPALWPWFGILALVSLTALVRWPARTVPAARVLFAHRLSAVVLAAFVLAHVVNQAIAFVSLPAYAAMRAVMRGASQHPATYALIVGAVAIQIATGTAVGLRKVRAGSFGANVQAVTGWYLAAFLLTHVFTGAIMSLFPSPAPPVAAADPFNLLATARSAAQVPYLVLGVAAFLVHVGVYARLAATAYLAEAAVRRLSYASVVVATTLVVTVGLALCGVRLSAQTPPPGAMPYTAVRSPQFVAASEAGFLRDDDIVLGVVSARVARAYPAADLAQHGAVSDTLPDGPVSVTWCGVCNTGLVFRASVNGRTLHFEYDRMVGGNEVQKDAETGSSWQQATGEALDGPLKGSRLSLYPTVRTTWGAWRQRYPQSQVLKPLPGYAERMPTVSARIKSVTRAGPDGAPRGALALDTRLPPRETVAGLEIDRDAVAYPFTALRVARVVNDRVAGRPILIVHQPSSDTTTAFEARVKGRALTFRTTNADASALVDAETRSTWNAYGLSLDGPLKGTQLETVTLVPQFWFAWSQFRPGTRVFTATQTPVP
jgi:hypothetical protein